MAVTGLEEIIEVPDYEIPNNNGKQDIQNYWDLQVMGLRWYLYRLWQLM